MQLFIDTADIEEIRCANDWGIIDGVTTNPSLMAKVGRTTAAVIREIVSIVDGPISAEVLATEAKSMIEEGRILSQIHKNVVIKLPMTIEGVKALNWFSKNGIKTNLTLVFSPNQALLAAKCGATYISPFVGRLDDHGHDGMELIREIRTIFDNYAFTTKILSASIRSTLHVREAALAASDVATVPFKVLKDLYSHPLTDRGVEAFTSDYKKVTTK
ncbi:MAG: fructose-6-phosphate aldolase [Oligoflexia bacterium]|nr:fructose-6-phosphate aldolase [Oligoflexia bacterium]MBF0366239.1 fructose-6-phosphate aldolase [Oligoflexia bacterium]